MNALDIGCPTCEALVGAACISLPSQGGAAREPHIDRTELARVAPPPS